MWKTWEIFGISAVYEGKHEIEQKKKSKCSHVFNSIYLLCFIFKICLINKMICNIMKFQIFSHLDSSERKKYNFPQQHVGNV